MAAREKEIRDLITPVIPKTTQDLKNAQYLKDLKQEQELLTGFDKTTTDLLHKKCCDDKETAQFSRYMASEPCTSVCQYPEIPGDVNSGGWFQGSFLMVYTRFIIETMRRIQTGDDHFSPSRCVGLLQRELDIAVAAYQSAVDRTRLDETTQKTKIDSENARRLYGQINMRLRKSMEDGIESEKMEQEAIEKINKHQAECYNAHSPCSTAKGLKQELETVSAQKASNAKATMELKQRLETVRTRYQQAQQASKKAQDSWTKTLLDRIDALPLGGHHCQAAGFPRHAIYVSFQKLGDKIQARIYNLGAGSEASFGHHIRVPGTNLILPAILNFSTDSEGRTALSEFCGRICTAITTEENEAIQLIYQRVKQFADAKHVLDLYNTGDVTAEIEQTTVNCTSKGSFHALRDRSEPAFYKRLFLSLFLWSKNAYFIRKESLPANNQELITEDDLNYLRKSEAAFAGESSAAIRAMIANTNNFKIMYRPPTQIPTIAITQPLPSTQGATQSQLLSRLNVHLSSTRFRIPHDMDSHNQAPLPEPTPLRFSNSRSPRDMNSYPQSITPDNRIFWRLTTD